MVPFQRDVSLREYCTFGIGGPARYFVEVSTFHELQHAFSLCHAHQLPYFILGKGSNCLFDDRGFDGLVIYNKIDFWDTPQPGTFHVGAGYSFSLLGTQTARLGWSGLEFASGIPGSVGGAVFMNAGANGGETCQCLLSVEYIDAEGGLQEYKREDLNFSYRYSPFQKMSGAIVAATFALSPSPTARARQIEIIEYRKKTQPLRDKSAGCMFRNPQCGHAGALIEQSGLKNICVGGAQVSEKHANFIVNTGKATAKDVLELVSFVQQRVKEKTGVELESEVRYIC